MNEEDNENQPSRATGNEGAYSGVVFVVVVLSAIVWALVEYTLKFYG